MTHLHDPVMMTDDAILFGAMARGCTEREAEVLAAYVASSSAKEAAYRLGIAEGTVRNHMARIHRRLGVAHTAAAVALVLRRGRAA